MVSVKRGHNWRITYVFRLTSIGNIQRIRNKNTKRLKIRLEYIEMNTRSSILLHLNRPNRGIYFFASNELLDSYTLRPVNFHCIRSFLCRFLFDLFDRIVIHMHVAPVEIHYLLHSFYVHLINVMSSENGNASGRKISMHWWKLKDVKQHVPTQAASGWCLSRQSGHRQTPTVNFYFFFHARI